MMPEQGSLRAAAVHRLLRLRSRLQGQLAHHSLFFYDYASTIQAAAKTYQAGTCPHPALIHAESAFNLLAVSRRAMG